MASTIETPGVGHQDAPVTDVDIERLRRILLETYGFDVSTPEAAATASSLMLFYRVLLGPLPHDPEHRG